MRISVVILTHNQRDYTIACLRSLSMFISNPDHEVILVDNGSTDDTLEHVRSEFPKVTILPLSSNRGVAAGRNAGLSLAKGELLMILDNDTIVPAGTIEKMADYFERNPEIGVLAPRLISPSGDVQASFKPFPGIAVKIRNILSKKHNTSIARRLPKKPIHPFYVIGAAQMFSRHVYEMAGPLDEKIFFGPEDADFCMSVRSVWKRVVFNPDFTIVHHWQRATTGKIFSKAGRRHSASLLYFYIKHHRFI